MNAIACLDKKNGIGRSGKLLFHLKKDMAFFRKMTDGKVVIMGSGTYRAIGGPLKNRVNIVLSSQNRGDVTNAHSVQEVLDLVRFYRPEDVFVIGGPSVYEQFLPYCEVLYITRVEADGNADVFFPEKGNDWEISESSEELDDNGYKIRFLTYRKRKDS